MNVIKLQQKAHRLWLKGHSKLGGGICLIIYYLSNCAISYKAKIGKGTALGYGGIGCVIHAQAIIGENCKISQNVTIAAKNGKAPKIGNNVFIGANSVIIGDVELGDNCFVGALSLVNKSFPANIIIVGSPAKLLRLRDSEELGRYNKWRNK